MHKPSFVDGAGKLLTRFEHLVAARERATGRPSDADAKLELRFWRAMAIRSVLRLANIGAVDLSGSNVR